MYELYYNQRIKTYPNGMKVIATFNKTVFNPLHNKRDPCCERAPPEERLPFEDDFRDRTDNLKRSIEKVFDIALMNPFEWFVTLTIDPKKLNSYDIVEVNRVVKKWFNNMVNRNDLKYLCVPEYHKSGRLHLHCLMTGNLEMIDSGTVKIPDRKKPVKIEKAKIICPDETLHKIVYNLKNWNFGYSTALKFEKCDDGLHGTSAVAKYLTKYITKDNLKIMRNYYYAGGHLDREVYTEYKIVDYNSVYAPEIEIKNTELKVKYITMGVI